MKNKEKEVRKKGKKDGNRIYKKGKKGSVDEVMVNEKQERNKYVRKRKER